MQQDDSEVDPVNVPEESTEAVLEAVTKEMAHVICHRLPPDTQFALFLIPNGQGPVSYASTLDRDSVLGALTEWIERERRRA